MTEHITHESLAPAGVNARRVSLVAGAILLLLGGAMGILAGIFLKWAPDNGPPTVREFPAPQLQTHPADELQRQLAKQRLALSRYRWANTDHTLVAIPIERAMEIITQRGTAGYEPITPRATSQPVQGVKP